MREGLPEGCRLLMLGDVMRRGKAAPAPRMFVPGRAGAPEDALVSLYYTSGSTGLPKGAMYTDKLWRRWWCALCHRVVTIVHASMPLSLEAAACCLAAWLLSIYDIPMAYGSVAAHSSSPQRPVCAGIFRACSVARTWCSAGCECIG